MSVAANPVPPRAKARFVFGLAIASGLLLYAAFTIPWLSWLLFFALAPFALLVRLRARLVVLYSAALAGGLAFYFPGLFWIGLCAPAEWQAWLARTLLSTYCALYFPFALLVARLLNRRLGVPVLIALPIAWVTGEYLRMTLMSGFGWLMIAHGAYEWALTIQIADFAGAYGVSFLLVMVNALFVELLTQPLLLQTPKGLKFDPTGALKWRIAATIAALLGTWTYGWARTRNPDFRPGPTVLIAQSAIPQSVRDFLQDDALRRLIEQLDAAVERGEIKGADLVLWPETSFKGFAGEADPTVADNELERLYWRRAFPGGLTDEQKQVNSAALIRENFERSKALLHRLANQYGAPLAVGINRHVFKPGNYANYNSMILVTPEQGEVAVYNKIHLVPFGEYLPLENQVPLLRYLMPYPDDVQFGLDRGVDFAPIHHGTLCFAPLICFEDTTPYVPRAMVRNADPKRPVDFLVNQSNDGWFPNSREPEYHLANAVFRCVECRKPMVRGTNLGVSALIDANGRVVRRLPPADEGTLRVQVPLDDRSTLYLAWGDWLPLACAAFTLAALATILWDVVRLVRARLARSATLST